MSETEPPIGLFESEVVVTSAGVHTVMENSLRVAESHVDRGSVYDADGQIAQDVVDDLATAGYWGLRAEPQYGGSGATLGWWAPFVARMTTVDPWVAGMSSCHAGLGPVNLVSRFGDDDQKARLLPPLAAGRRLGAFAVTEPGTAADWAAITTTAEPEGDVLLLTGEKLFITNAAGGRTAAVLCQIDGNLRMLIAELPDADTAGFHTVSYDLRAPRHLTNRALVFDRLAVPSANLLGANGRGVAYHGLNHGRVLVCAFAAGLLRLMAGLLVPWVRTRETFGAPIGSRQLVRHRLGRLAGRIVACDALLAWTSQLLDSGYRGELECVTTKVVASEMLKEATVDLLLKTYASRAFLPGNLFSDAVHDLLAPTVYEGENEMLTLGFASSLIKARLPLLGTLPAGPSPSRPASTLDPDDLVALAVAVLRESGSDVDAALRTHGPTIADRQALVIDLAQRIQQAATMICVVRYSARHPDPTVRDAGLCMALEIALRLMGERPTGGYHDLLTRVGAAVADGDFGPTAQIPASPIPMIRHATNQA